MPAANLLLGISLLIGIPLFFIFFWALRACCIVSASRQSVLLWVAGQRSLLSQEDIEMQMPDVSVATG